MTIEEAVGAILTWGEARDWRGYDPYDGLNSPLARALPGALPRRLLTQTVKLSPLNLRPLLRIPEAHNQKAIGLVASGYARLDEREHASRWLDWLTQNRADADGAYAWGYHFPVRTRVFAYPRNAPNTIATSFVAQALLDGCELVGDDRWSRPARLACDWLLSAMLATDLEGRTWFRYVPGEDELVHNANVLAAAVLARAARVLDEPELLEPARRATETTLAAQRPDGSWPYAEGSHGWVDNFHTGYVLESLAALPGTQDALRRGLDFWRRELFLGDGTPKYYPDSTLPVDAHCYAQAVETWLAVGELSGAERAARLLVDRMLDPAGYVWFQRRRLWTSRVPYVRWTTAPSFRALAGLLRARELRRREERAGARLG